MADIFLAPTVIVMVQRHIAEIFGKELNIILVEVAKLDFSLQGFDEE